MKSKILVVYQFATFGGVERVLLNRAEAFKHYNLNYKLYVYFYEDLGAKKALKKYIIDNELSEYIEIINKFNPKDYDYVVSIDTPQIFNDKRIKVEDVIIETHTIERQYRRYLDKYINKVKKVIVPSKTFYDIITNEYEEQTDNDKIVIIDNFVPWEIKTKEEVNIKLPGWGKNIIFYFGRMDTNKNIIEMIKALKLYNEKYNNNLILLLIGKIDPNYNLIKFVKENQMESKVVLLPPINFDKIDDLLNILKKQNAIFVSSSKGETFSLSAAEAISHDLPVVLSNISAHTTLVKSHKQFLYELGNIKDLVQKINDIIIDNIEIENMTNKLKKDLSARKFIDMWQQVFTSENIL